VTPVDPAGDQFKQWWNAAAVEVTDDAGAIVWLDRMRGYDVEVGFRAADEDGFAVHLYGVLASSRQPGEDVARYLVRGRPGPDLSGPIAGSFSLDRRAVTSAEFRRGEGRTLLTVDLITFMVYITTYGVN